MIIKSQIPGKIIIERDMMMCKNFYLPSPQIITDKTEHAKEGVDFLVCARDK